MGSGLDTLITLVAALSAGIALTCLLLLLFNLLQRVKVEDISYDYEIKKSLPILIRMAMPLISNVRFIARGSGFTQVREQTREQLFMAGYGDSISDVDFLSVKLLFGLLGVAALVFCVVFGRPWFGIVLLVALPIYPGAWLKKTIKQRHHEIVRALPNVLDLLTLSVEAGKDFLTSLRDILGRRRLDALGEELQRTFQEIQLGKKRTTALRELSERVRQPDLSAVLNAIVQAEELGVSIGQLLRIQGDMLRNKRFSRAEKLANEAPVKILFPVIVFIFPAVMIILMVPILMQAFKLLAR